jgi:hypothetical protein
LKPIAPLGLTESHSADEHSAAAHRDESRRIRVTATQQHGGLSLDVVFDARQLGPTVRELPKP